jgi:hypothetical protein
MEEREMRMGCGKMGMERGCGKMCVEGMDHMMWHGTESDKVEMMLFLAKKARMELLKEKMKKKLDALEGKKLDQVADLIVNAMLGRHKMEREGMEKKEDLLDKLDEIWMEE